ncbi:MAG: hypothetical protein HY299_06975 [Verrucomicrobia bacterium]|nr:hypothetical protein [Verrucomicrobiota bacterium]
MRSITTLLPVAALWRKRARLPDSWLPFPFGVIHILSAEQALEYGVVDEVIDR